MLGVVNCMYNVCILVALFRSTRHVAYLHVKMYTTGNSLYVITIQCLLLVVVLLLLLLLLLLL